jgi:CDP-glucose 4,6-dehydratase
VKPAFWKGRRVLLTGHTGFKGSWLCIWLKMMGARVTGYALQPPTDPSLFELAGVADGMISRHGDIRNLDELSGAVSDSSPDIIIHMAAQALVRRSYAAPVDTFSTNVMGTVNVLEAARMNRCVKSVVVVTSDKCYENNEWIWGYRESDPMGGHDPYSSSKGCAELVTAAYRKSFFTNGHRRMGIATARAGNVIGGGDWSDDRLLPDFFRAVLAGKKLGIRAPDAVRPWQHVLEPLRGYLELAEQLYNDPAYASGAWNFGPGDDAQRPVSAVVDEAARLWGGGARWTKVRIKNAPHEAGILALDCSKARTELGWRPDMSLPDALKLTVDWYKAYANGKDMRRTTESQVRQYMKRLGK